MELENLESDPKVRAFTKLVTPLLGVLLIVGAVSLVPLAARLILEPRYRAPLDNPAGGILLLAIAIGVLAIAQRLLTRARGSAGAVLPSWLIVLGSVLFLFAPLVLYKTTHNIHLVMLSSALWTGVAASGLRLVSSRKRNNRR